jgi:hypothetical protein
MAVLQAARAHALGLPEDSAFSWGLNRAIFYAAAKKGFRGGGTASRGKPSEKGATREKHENPEEFFLGDEKAFIDRDSSTKSKPQFEIGDEAQTSSDFERQIASRFGDRANFKEVWDEAMKVVNKYDKDILKSQHEFYEQVYKPRRDALSKKWTEEFTGKKKAPVAARA